MNIGVYVFVYLMIVEDEQDSTHQNQKCLKNTEYNCGLSTDMRAY